MSEIEPVPTDQVVPARGRLNLMAWQLVGGVSLVLGAIGVIAPLLPTTPFVILAAFAFAKSAPALHNWLLQNRTFGPIIRDWRANGAIAPRYKAIALVMMCAAIVVSIAMQVPVVVLGVQAVCMTAAASFILTRPSHGA